jgi:hypothetical protein
MGFESLKSKPSSIESAVKAGDTEYLKAAGQKGAEVANRNRDLATAVAAAEAERKAERLSAEEQALRESTNEHILTSDGEDPDEINEAAD